MTRFHDAPEKSVIGVATINDENRALRVLRQIKVPGCRDISDLAVGNLDEIGNLAADVEGGVQLDGTLRSTKFCPRENVKAEIDGFGVDGPEIILERESRCCPVTEAPAFFQHLVEQGFVDLEGAFLVFFGQGRACIRLQSQVVPCAVPQTIQTHVGAANAVIG